MAKTEVNQYDTTANNNTDANGVSIAEGMSPAYVNDSIREIMAAIARFVAGTVKVTGLWVGASGVKFNDGTSQTTAATGTVTSVATGTGLSGGPITGTGTVALANTAVTPGSYGSASAVPVVTVDAQGRLTAASTASLGLSSISMATVRLIGRTTAGSGAMEEITVGAGLSLSSGSLSATSTGGRTSIASGSLSGTTLSLTSIPATYAYLVLQITGMSFTAAATPTLRASTNNGVSYDSTAANYGGLRTNVDSVPAVTTASIGVASMLASRVLSGSDTCDVTITIKPYAGGTWAQWTAVISDSAGNVSTVIGVYKSTSAINALQLAGGTFDAGTYQLDGVS